MSRDLGDWLRVRARELGLARLGVAPTGGSEHMRFYRDWIAAGAHGEMAYLARPDAIARRAGPERTLPGVRSVVVVAHEYFQEDPPGSPGDPSRGVIARYARGRDYHKVLKGKLLTLLAGLRERAGHPVVGRAYVDTGPILERELARRAGLGWFGKNTMLIHPRAGSWFFLGCLLLDLELEPDTVFAPDHCGNCSRCLEACPTGALLGRDESGAPRIDARRCISYLTIEQRGPIPPELRPLLGNRVFGCDICQEVCPFNVRFAEEATDPGYAAREPGEPPAGVQAEGGEGWPVSPHPGTSAPPLVDLMRMTPQQWDSFTRGSAIRRAGYPGFRRNVAVAMGNWLAGVDEPSANAVAALIEALHDPSPLVRGHAAWALGRTDSPAAGAALEERARIETEPTASREISTAIAGREPRDRA